MMMMMMPIHILLNISNLYADAVARSMTPSRNTWSYTLRSVPSSPGRSFLTGLLVTLSDSHTGALINSDAVLVTKKVAVEKCFWGNDWILMDCNIAHWLTPHGIFHLLVYQSCPLRHLVGWCNIADMMDATRTAPDFTPLSPSLSQVRYKLGQIVKGTPRLKENENYQKT